MSDYIVLKHLGNGGFASVHLIQHTTFGRVAYKKLAGSNLPDTDLIRLKKESDIQLRLRHPNIVSMFEAQFSSPDIGLFLEYMQYGSVDTFIREYTVTWEWKTQILYDFSLAMTYLHQQRPVIIHGDLKSQNVLIGDGYRAKISDFGLSRTMQTLSSSDIERKLSGTLEYIAPEYLDDPYKKKSEKFDVYGFAISAWEIYSRKSFFRGFIDAKLIGVHVQNGTRPRMEAIRDNIPANIKELIENCWQHNADDRPTFKSIRDIFSAELSSNLFDLKLPHKKKIPKHDIEESYQSACDQTDFISSVQGGAFDQSRAGNKFIKGLKREVDSVCEYLDPFNGLVICLKQRGILTDAECEELNKTFPKGKNSHIPRNKKLLKEFILPRVEYCCMEFIEALKDNDQEHIVNFIMNAGEHLDRVLSKEEIRIIDDNMSCLVNLIDPYKMGFMDLLVSTKCITGRHGEMIERCDTRKEQNSMLMQILKLRNYRHFSNFKLCLLNTKQDEIVAVLEKGHVFVAHAILRESMNVMDLETLNHSSVDHRESATLQLAPLKNLFNLLDESGIHLVGSYNSNEEHMILYYFQCPTCGSFEMLRNMCASGHLKGVLESVYRSILRMPGSKPTLVEDIVVDPKDFNSNDCGNICFQSRTPDVSEYFDAMADNEDRRRLLRNNPPDRTRCRRTCCCVTTIVVLVILIAAGVLVGLFVCARRNDKATTTPPQTTTTTAHPTTHTMSPTTVATTLPHESTTKSTVKEYFRIRSVLCNKPLCASGENSRIVICENGSAYDWFQSSDNTTIRWREDDRLGFSALGHNFTLTAFEGNKRQFWYIYGHNITNRLDPNEVVDLRNSNCSNGADLQRFTYSSSAENQKWDFVYIN